MTIIQHIIGLVETKIALAKLEIKEETSKIISGVLVGIILGTLIFMFWFFLMLACGFFLNRILDSQFMGVIIVSGFHLFMFIILLIFREELGLEKAIGKRMDGILFMNGKNEDEGGTTT